MDKADRIRRFLSDPHMSAAVFEVLHSTFIRPGKSTDVQTLAAERIAINLLQDAMKELQKYKSEGDAAEKSSINRAL